MLNILCADPIFYLLWSNWVLIFANSIGVQIIELAMPATNPEAMSSASLGTLNLFVNCTNVQKTVNSKAVAIPINRYIEDAPRQKALKKLPLCLISYRRYCRLMGLLSCSLVLMRSRGMPVVTRDQPARLPARNQISMSSIDGNSKKNNRCVNYNFHTTDTERGGIPNYTLQEYYQKSKEKSEDSEARRQQATNTIRMMVTDKQHSSVCKLKTNKRMHISNY